MLLLTWSYIANDAPIHHGQWCARVSYIIGHDDGFCYNLARQFVSVLLSNFIGERFAENDGITIVDNIIYYCRQDFFKILVDIHHI